MNLLKSRSKVTEIAAFSDLSLQACTFMPDGRRIAVGCGGGNAHILDPDTGSTVTTVCVGTESRIVFGHEEHLDIREISISSDGRRLGVCRTGGRSLEVWDVESGSQVLSRDLTKSDEPLFGFTQAIALSPDASTVAVACSVGQSGVLSKLPGIYAYDLQTGDGGHRFSGHQMTNVVSPVDNQINDVAFSPDGRFLISAGDDGRVIVWALDSTEDDGPQRLIEYSNSIMRRVSFSHDGTAFAAGLCSFDERRDRAPEIERSTVGLHTSFTALVVEHGWVDFLAFSGDDSRLLVACRASDRARPAASHSVWVSSLGSTPEVVKQDFGEVVAISPDASRIASWADDTLRIWDVSRFL